MTSTSRSKMNNNNVRGWHALFGCTSESLAIFRIALGFLLVCELVLRFRFLHVFYTDEGTMPLRLLLPKIDTLYKSVCLHCHFGELWQQQLLLAFQTTAAVLLTVGYQTKIMSIISWYMYSSLILRNTWLYFILDRYFYYLLFYSMFLPLDEKWSLSSRQGKSKATTSRLIVNPATIGIKLLVFWIYLDAGGGKWLDPKKGWTYNASPLPALDTYTRHTLVAQYLYGLLGPQGLRVMTPIVVYVELFSCPLAMLGSYLGNAWLVKFAVGLMCHLHVGISFTIRNSVLLSYIACTAWSVFLPIGWDSIQPVPQKKTKKSAISRLGGMLSLVLVGGMAASNIWFENGGKDCSSAGLRQIWTVLLQNRWNVFVGAEEYVTWEIAPGRLADGSVVDVWGRRESVDWSMPGTGAPCTSTARPGRWRSFPYLADLDDDESKTLWSYLCRQWDSENDVGANPGRKLTKFNFFMLQADVLPNMGFSATRKRLVKSFDCVADVIENRDEGDENNTIVDVTSQEL